jgi:hypothetical protein
MSENIFKFNFSGLRFTPFFTEKVVLTFVIAFLLLFLQQYL